MVRKHGNAMSSSIQLMLPISCIIRAPIRMRTGAVAMTGTAAHTGMKNMAVRKSTPVTTADSPVRAPSLTPAQHSKNMITGLHPSTADVMVIMPTTAKAICVNSVSSSSATSQSPGSTSGSSAGSGRMVESESNKGAYFWSLLGSLLIREDTPYTIPPTSNKMMHTIAIMLGIVFCQDCKKPSKSSNPKDLWIQGTVTISPFTCASVMPEIQPKKVTAEMPINSEPLTFLRKRKDVNNSPAIANRHAGCHHSPRATTFCEPSAGTTSFN
mmetsp:Transcript_19003/g.32922  ORF Transcript_19003/g.32922 Transcript_19003/m.32922 type:complete len:269 (+) Transcript_19003:2152-2958(+)